jgi:L-fucose isomerase-like protein
MARAIERTADYAEHNSANTRAACKLDFLIFAAWCTGRGMPSLPASAEAVAGFLAAEANAGHKASTIGPPVRRDPVRAQPGRPRAADE